MKGLGLKKNKILYGNRNIAIVLKPEDQNVPLNFMSDRFKDVRPLVGEELKLNLQMLLLINQFYKFIIIMSPDHLGYCFE